jgi:hypothetical protein
MAALERLLRSKKFQQWSRSTLRFKGVEATEPHLSPTQLGKLWGVSAQTIRNIFKAEPDVLRHGHGNGHKNSKRDYVLMRIPQSVIERVHRRLSALP